MIIFNDKIGEYLKLHPELDKVKEATESLSPRLMLIYFGLCAISVGVTIYSMICPGEVRHYGSANAYARGDGPAIKDFVFEEIERKLSESPKAKALIRIRNRYERGQGPPITEAQKAQVNNGVLHLYFEYLNEKSAAWRSLVWLFYAIGFVCLVIPSFGVFAQISKKLWLILTTNFSAFL